MQPKIQIFFIITLLLTGCGSPSTQAPTVIPAIHPTAASLVPFDERVLATINTNEHPLATPNMVGNHPDEIVFTQGFIWTRTDNGHVIQVDPATNRMVAAIKVDTTSDLNHYCQGLGTDGENIWVCSASGDEDNRTIDVVRIDPQTQSIVETVKVNKVFDQFYLPFLLNQIWVLSGSGDKLVGIEVTTNQPNPAIELGTRCFQLAAVGDTLMATCRLDNLVIRIDPKKREVTGQTTLASPRLIAGTEDAIWVAQDNAVVRLDPETFEPVVTFTKLKDVGIFGDIFVAEESVWVRQESGFLYHIDPTSNKIVEQIKIDQSLTGGSVLVTSDSIWTTANEDNLLIRLSLK